MIAKQLKNYLFRVSIARPGKIFFDSAFTDNSEDWVWKTTNNTVKFRPETNNCSLNVLNY